MLREEIEQVKAIAREIAKEEIALAMETGKKKPVAKKDKKVDDVEADIADGAADSTEK